MQVSIYHCCYRLEGSEERITEYIKVPIHQNPETFIKGVYDWYNMTLKQGEFRRIPGIVRYSNPILKDIDRNDCLAYVPGKRRKHCNLCQATVKKFKFNCYYIS